MGLDMYLYARQYFSAYSHCLPEERNVTNTIAKACGIALASEAPGIYVSACVGYWRKANAIHAWFVRLGGGDDNQEKICVSRDDLQNLKDTCLKVLNNIELVDGKVCKGHVSTGGKPFEPVLEDGQLIAQPKIAEDLLPTQDGFFFGKTDYDEDYVEDLKDTVTIIDRALELNKDWAFEYEASW